MNKEMLKGTIDLLILSILQEMDSYGYEISKAIKERTEGEFEIQEATLYLSLKRLEKQKAISAYWGNQSHGGRRKYYAITAEGKDLLQTFIHDWRHMAAIIERFI
ncbi:PadR family transcriptional regulator [Domibacillus robiginosus]|uniref:PadR family transcriptional regulator n=1 Tax=Domibacillus robiginosus TaxID=1071054 RepID=UPI00067AE168|nr:helix-turn-helix transcriptional regulator [Domibacillus robiginosus]